MAIKMAHIAVKKGDILYADRGLYRHYGIYNNNRSVIHFSSAKGAEISAKNAYIRETTLVEFLKGGELHIDRTIRAVFPPEEIVRRARRFVNELRGKYDLLSFNCEHFARWCATGELDSEQVKTGLVIAGTIAVTAAAALVIKAIVDEGEEA
ncbi:MAG: lecithin retinol acyltransferase family protein [Spirochaetaceae bacterium]|jgi:hypothetical protein|nr:lecithin retinol acyltransferase family protein [Spirochaetaceae bacterium]